MQDVEYVGGHRIVIRAYAEHVCVLLDKDAFGKRLGATRKAEAELGGNGPGREVYGMGRPGAGHTGMGEGLVSLKVANWDWLWLSGYVMMLTTVVQKLSSRSASGMRASCITARMTKGGFKVRKWRLMMVGDDTPPKVASNFAGGARSSCFLLSFQLPLALLSLLLCLGYHLLPLARDGSGRGYRQKRVCRRPAGSIMNNGWCAF